MLCRVCYAQTLALPLGYHEAGSAWDWVVIKYTAMNLSPLKGYTAVALQVETLATATSKVNNVWFLLAKVCLLYLDILHSADQISYNVKLVTQQRVSQVTLSLPRLLVRPLVVKLGHKSHPSVRPASALLSSLLDRPTATVASVRLHCMAKLINPSL